MPISGENSSKSAESAGNSNKHTIPHSPHLNIAPGPGWGRRAIGVESGSRINQKKEGSGRGDGGGLRSSGKGRGGSATS